MALQPLCWTPFITGSAHNRLFPTFFGFRTSMVDQDGHWSDTQATAETDEPFAHKRLQGPAEQVVAQDKQDITPQKVSSDHDKRPLSPASGLAIDAPTSAERPEDSRSVQSLPLVRVTESSEMSQTTQDTPASMDVQRPPVSPRPPRTPTSLHDPRSARRASTFPEVNLPRRVRNSGGTNLVQ